MLRPVRTVADWAALLRSAAAESGVFAGQAPSIEGFRDELGQHRPTDEPFLRWRAHRAGAAPRRLAVIPGALDAALWASLLGDGADAESLLGGVAGAERSEMDRGSLLPRSMHRTIEVWTETELAALHALSWLGRTSGRSHLSARCRDAVVWHVEHLQPDNATNRPWSVHLFAEAGVAGDLDAQMYAETLLHNCRVGLGRPDRLSAHICLDAAEWLSGA
ncbi:MAG: hypothetical protein SFZ24_07215 [Planctomycetota bacterium]|nr:hypothetical protein [Planctomycetota bacterium]